jgi:serine/threonine protein kinase
MLMSLHHPNILKVHEYTLRDNNTLVIVQDSCIEGTLAENISNSRIDAKKLMQDIAIGVRYLHK